MRTKTGGNTTKLNFKKPQYLKKFMFKSIAVICILSLTMFLKKFNFRQTNAILNVVKENIQYEFSLKDDGKKIFRKIQGFAMNSMEKIAVFNPMTKIDKYPSPIQGKVFKQYDKDTNQGIDIKATLSDEEPVSVTEGIVKNIEQKDKKGYYITVQNGNMDYVYGYLSKPYVSKGDSVSVGQPIGGLGTNVDGHKYLRFEIWIDGSSVDPLYYIDMNSMPQ